MHSVLRMAVGLIAALGLGADQPAAAGNRLAGHPSPYLAMHAQDPVQWREWDEAALAEARRQNRLLLVSVGYFACHWCHVMQRETFLDPEAARLINAEFIPVKVDREVNAALDTALQDFAQRVGGRSGWPLNVFVTPEGHPLFAMQYAPRAEFMRTAQELGARWRQNAAGLAALARAASAAPEPAPPPADLPGAFARRAQEEADPLRGGFGQTAKFPLVPQLAAVLELQRAAPQAERAEFLRLTLDQMAGQALYDHVSGGFFRYTVDPDWQAPHFEKMLYDNAQLAALYLRAAEALGEPRYRAVALETLDFLLAQMREGPAFVASLSAVDRAGVEGGAYLWQAEAIRALLSPQEWQAVRRLWVLDRPAEFEAGYLPAPVSGPGAGEAALVRQALARLRAAGKWQGIPRDGKQLAGWNGLALAALAEAGRHEPRYAEAAAGLYRFLRERLWDGRRLHKGRSAGQSLGGAELEDYAYAALGVWRYARAQGDAQARRFALELQRQAWRRFHRDGAFRLEERALLAAAADAWEDGHTPAPAAVLVGLGLESQDARLAGLAAKALAQARRGAGGDPFWRASLAVLAD